MITPTQANAAKESDAQLQDLAAWLAEQHVESVAIESTYVYWIPIYELLESRGIEVLLVNARQLHHGAGTQDRL